MSWSINAKLSYRSTMIRHDIHILNRYPVKQTILRTDIFALRRYGVDP